MENFVYYNSLFDIYNEMLTEKEKENFRDYYQEDLSLAEIADAKKVSRNAVFKTIKNVIDKLESYENKLHIYANNCKLNEALLMSDINDVKKIIEEVLK